MTVGQSVQAANSGCVQSGLGVGACRPAGRPTAPKAVSQAPRLMWARIGSNGTAGQPASLPAGAVVNRSQRGGSDERRGWGTGLDGVRSGGQRRGRGCGWALALGSLVLQSVGTGFP